MTTPAASPTPADHIFERTKFDSTDWPIVEQVYNEWFAWNATKPFASNGSWTSLDWREYFRWYGLTYPGVAAAHPRVFDVFLRPLDDQQGFFEDAADAYAWGVSMRVAKP